jgi:hypothetical protein
VGASGRCGTRILVVSGELEGGETVEPYRRQGWAAEGRTRVGNGEGWRRPMCLVDKKFGARRGENGGGVSCSEDRVGVSCLL